MRPNAIPSRVAGKNTLGENIEAAHNSGFRAGRNLKMIKDLCDFCNKYAFIYRNQIGLRTRGRKFMCNVCRFGDANRQEEAKKNGYMPCWTTTMAMKPNVPKRYDT